MFSVAVSATQNGFFFCLPLGGSPLTPANVNVNVNVNSNVNVNVNSNVRST